MPYEDPIAFFFTWSTYGTWLPGDARGWVEYRTGFRLPDPVRELEARAKMTEDACRLNQDQRREVEWRIAETCKRRSWTLHVSYSSAGGIGARRRDVVRSAKPVDLLQPDV